MMNLETSLPTVLRQVECDISQNATSGFRTCIILFINDCLHQQQTLVHGITML